MNAPVFFKSAGDERGTPQDFFDKLNAEFHFELDASASEHNHKCDLWFGFGGVASDALEADWGGSVTFLNPPYSVIGAFVAKAREEANKGATVVMLLPVRSETKYWQQHIWDKHALRNGLPDGDWYPGVRGRFLAQRLSFELYVPEELRVWIKKAMGELGAGESPERWNVAVKELVEQTGLPKMAIEGILIDKADDDLLSSAPFPSAIIIFEKAVS